MHKFQYFFPQINAIVYVYIVHIFLYTYIYL